MEEQQEDDGDQTTERFKRDYARGVEMVKAHTAQLAEHFDSVVIICTKTVDGRTFPTMWGAGNWYAQFASAQEFCTHCQQRVVRDTKG